MTGFALVGRERELELLREGLAALASGRGSLFFLTGEPGIGKTRLADELAAHAARAGATVAWGAAWDGGGAPAYWPWIEVVRALRPLVPAPDERLRRDLGPAVGRAGRGRAGRRRRASRTRTTRSCSAFVASMRCGRCCRPPPSGPGCW